MHNIQIAAFFIHWMVSWQRCQGNVNRSGYGTSADFSYLRPVSRAMEYVESVVKINAFYSNTLPIDIDLMMHIHYLFENHQMWVDSPADNTSNN